MRAQGFERWTYGLKERCPDSLTPGSHPCCSDSDSVVATMVATKTDDKACKSCTPLADLDRVIEVLPTDLARVVSVWSHLPEPLRQAILAIVENASDGESRAGVADD